MKKILQIILINILVLFSLIVLLDLFSLTFMKVSKSINTAINNSNNKTDFRAKFPVYKNVSWSNFFYDELYKISLEYRSYYGWRALFFNGKAINIDSNGIRKTIDYHPLISKNKSIAFFGGSTTWGFGVNDSNTIPSLFSKISKGDYKIINYGEQAYRAHQSLQLMQIEYVTKDLPNIVIFYDGANNYRASNERFFSTNRENSIIERLKGMDQNINGVNSENADATQITKHYLYPTRFLLQKITNKFAIDKDKPNFKLTHSLKSDSLAAIELLETWLLAKNYVENKGSKFFCFLQPTYFSSNAKKSKYIENSITNGIHNNRTYSYYILLKKLIKLKKYETLQSNFYDLTNQFHNQDDIYIDFCHLGPNGNEIIANQIFNKIN